MKTIVAGCRSVDKKDAQFIFNVITNFNAFKITEVVSGGCSGVDIVGESAAKLLNVPVTVFKAEWDKYGNSAGPIRNKKMADYADCLIAFWDNESRGTKNMIEQALKNNLKVVVYYL